MRFVPDKSQAIALLAVWLVWPAISVFFRSVSPMLEQITGSLPFLTRLSFVVLQWNRMFLPSLAGTGILVAIVRWTNSAERRAFCCHLLTFSAFVFTFLTMACFSTFVHR